MSDKTFDISGFIKNLPDKPGVYQFLSNKGDILYVGKARNLKKRVSSYFRGTQQQPKTQHLIQQVVSIEIILTNSENEALLLESNLIKKHKPRYNILFRDDKSYPYLYVSVDHVFPRIDLYRGAKTGKGRYFGPYPNAGAVRETLNVLQKLFRIRQCNDTFFKNRARPCLQYQIKRCTAPCVAYINKEDYQKSVNHAVLFLEGKNQQIIHDLAERMQQASDALQFEEARHYRDLITSLRKTQEQQYVTGDGGNVDVIAVSVEQGSACVHLLYIRAGRIIGSKAYFPKLPKMSTDEDILTAFIPHYYLNPIRQQQIPDQLLINIHLPEINLLEQCLTEHHGKKVTLHTQVRGKRAKWLQLAVSNACAALHSHLSSKANIYQRYEDLHALLKLDTMPQRIECFDVSHTMGEATVASCVVFDINGPVKSDYRRFNISGITRGDDYAALSQALERRYKSLKKGEGKFPDVLFVDGGKGQLHQAATVLEELQVVGITLMGIAKGEGRKPEFDRLFTLESKQPMNLSQHPLAMHLIQQIRDEAHRFAIAGHRHKREKRRTTSILENIEGIGAKRRQQLLRQFGGLQELKRVSVEEIAKVPTISKALAQRIFDALHE